ncbi:hypothetical protein CUN34_02695 [Enterococcus faecium]|nr:hypothetical protein [Enterococcus faecium]EGP5152320.1 hypothetical protein [Enterococcus faecium]PQB67661.1 hypothetical protein CUN34_02695 [Enterococcus faecium]PQC00833.1 hypothetical protein CUN33_03450 [Enterococcus faecium]PQF74446.1 hypothetical protein CUS67_04765 [Enterococcus faecium]
MKNTLLLYLKFQYTTYRLLSENQNLLFLDVILSIVTAFLFFCIFFRRYFLKLTFSTNRKRYESLIFLKKRNGVS